MSQGPGSVRSGAVAARFGAITNGGPKLDGCSARERQSPSGSLELTSGHP